MAFIIRFIAGYVQSFSNDELSAIYRLQFSKFSDLYHWGIKIDGHPALVQLFLYYYTPLVPKGEIFIRLPFIIASTLSLPFIFFSLKKLSGEFTAYMVVIILAFSGFSIQLGYFARPYAFGILFTSVSSWYWIKIFIDKENPIKYLIFFILFSILAAYTHYFALLEIVVLGMASFVFAHWKQWWKMILAGIVCFLAYIPHYPITKFQMEVGGIGGWLGKPKDYFMIDLLLEYFDRSAIILGIFVLVPMILMMLYSTKPKLRNTFLFGFLSVVPFCILYFYSIKINSVLQFSACFFLMPFLLGTFFSVFETEVIASKNIKWAYVSVMLVFLTSTLYSNNAFAPIHFAEFKKIAQYIEEHESDSVTTVVAVNNPFYINYYLKDKRPDLYVTDMGDNLNFLKKFIDTCKTEEFIYAFANQRSNIEIPFIIKEKFPSGRWKNQFMNSELYHFGSRFQPHHFFDKDQKMVRVLNSESKLFEPEQEEGGPFSEYTLFSDVDFSPAFTVKLAELNLSKLDRLVASAGITGADRCDLEMVISIEDERGPVFWRSRKLSYQYGEYDNFEKDSLPRFRGDRFNVHRYLVIGESLDNSEIDLKKHILKVYLWNPNHCGCHITRFTVRILNGNKLVAGYSQ